MIVINYIDSFHEAVKKYPHNPAVVWQDKTVTYEDLDERSDRYSKALADIGKLPNSPIPLQADRSEDLIAQMLGIIKAGCVCVPISSHTHEKRVDFILNELSDTSCDPSAMLIYYTSGSTGIPKGVILSHESVLAMCKMHKEAYQFPKNVKAAVHADVGFDSFLLSTLPYLLIGGCLYIMSDTERLSLISTHKFLIRHRIETVFLTTAFGVAYMKAFDNKHLKVLLTGGEAITTYTPRSYKTYNLYGPTEFTAYVTSYLISGRESGIIPIGKPAGDTRAYIIDGELYLSGTQITNGYLNRPEETKERFLPNPYYDSQKDAPQYKKMYRTGDLAKWNDEGELLYLGRSDNQVKISGYRIELQEIELALCKHEAVINACVAAQRGEVSVFLTAYYTAKQEISETELRAFLSKALPSYMIPIKFVCLEKFPVDERTGKINRNELPK